MAPLFGGVETSDTCQPADVKSPSWNTTPGADDTASPLLASATGPLPPRGRAMT